MDKKTFLQSGLLKRYLLGLTSEEENQEIEQVMSLYPELRNEVENMQGSLALYAKVQMEKDLEQIKSQEQIINKGVSSGRANAYGLWLSLAFSIVLGIWCVGLQWRLQGLKNQYAQMKANYARLEERCNTEQNNRTQVASHYTFVCHPHTHPVFIHGTQLAPQAQATVYWNEQQQQALCHLSALPKAPHGKQYQLWADVNGAMVDMGVLKFIPDQLQQVAFIPGAESLNITLEPIGGSKTPTVELLYANGPIGVIAGR